MKTLPRLILSAVILMTSGVEWLSALDKLPTDSCREKSNLQLLHRCNPYKPGFILVRSEDLLVNVGRKKYPSEKRVPKTREFHYERRVSLQRLVDKYIDYKESILERRSVERQEKTGSVAEEKPVGGELKEKGEEEANLTSEFPPPAEEKSQTGESEENLSAEGNLSMEENRSGETFESTPAVEENVTATETPLAQVKEKCLESRAPFGVSGREECTTIVHGYPVTEEWFYLPETRMPAMIWHRVEKGETFTGLARKYGTTVYDLKQWNRLKRDHLLKIGERLKIYPGRKTPREKVREAEMRALSGHYKVQKGDTLIGIAKRFDVDRKELMRLNGLKKGSHIKLGQTLLLPIPQKKVDRILKQEEEERLAAQRAKERAEKKKKLIRKQYQFKYVGDKHFKRKIRVIATAYTSHRGQTDKTPFLAAWNNRIRPGMKIIAVSPDLIRRYGITNGVRVRISGLPGTYVVRDKMNKRLRNHIDIYMGTNRRKALRWGRRRVVLYW